MTYTVSGGALNSTQTKPRYARDRQTDKCYEIKRKIPFRFGIRCGSFSRPDRIISLWRPCAVANKETDKQTDKQARRRSHRTTPAWRSGQRMSSFMNEVNARRARLVLGWATVFGRGIPSRYVTSQLGQLSLASLWGRLIAYQLQLR